MEMVKGLWLNTSIPVANQPALRRNLITVTFPGFLSSRALVAKYTGPDAVTILDHARNHPDISDTASLPPIFSTTVKNAPRLMHGVLPLPDLDELDYNNVPWYSPIAWYNSARTSLQRVITSADCLPYSTNIPALNNLGGYLDQAAALEIIKVGIAALDAPTPSATNPINKRLVLFGFSRGATTFLQTSLKLEKKYADRVSMVVLEAPFDTIDGVIGDSSLFPGVSRMLLNRVGNPSPSDAYNMPEETHLTCPLVFITSEVDKRVPKKTTMRAIEEVRRRYPSVPVEHLELQHSMHSFMALQDVEDRARYIEFMEEMYNKYVPDNITNATYGVDTAAGNGVDAGDGLVDQ